MSLLNKTLAALVTSQAELQSKLDNVVKSQKSVVEASKRTLEKLEDVADHSRSQGKLFQELVGHVGNLAETQAEHSLRIKRLEDKVS